MATSAASRAWPMMSCSGSGCSIEQQVVVVESAEVGAVGAAVGGVGVDLERGVGADQVADRGDLLDVVARLDLQLDPDVAVVDVALHGGEQLVDRVVDADAHPARDAGGGGAEEVGERAVLRPELGVEDGHLERALGHRMAVQLGEAGSRRRRLRAGRRPPAGGAGGGSSRAGRRRRTRGSSSGRSSATHSPQPSVRSAVGRPAARSARGGCRARSGSRSSCGTARRAASRSGAVRLVPASTSGRLRSWRRSDHIVRRRAVNPTIGRPSASAP